jgi:type I restriction enzyme S subunit
MKDENKITIKNKSNQLKDCFDEKSRNDGTIINSSLRGGTTKQSVSLIPKLRFKEFEEEWERKKLGKIFKINAGGDISKKHVSQIQTQVFKYPIYANAEKNKGFYAYSDIYKAEKGTITVAGRGINIGIAHARNHKFYPIVRLLVLVPKKNENIYFYEYQINKINLFKESTGVPQLTAPQVSGYEVAFPNLPEQQKIASFLTSVDTKIQQLTTKKQYLENYKKGVMQQLFNQQLRFKPDVIASQSLRGTKQTQAISQNETEFPDWEEKRLGEVAMNIDYGMNSSAITYDGSNKYIRITDIDENSRKFIPSPLTSPNGNLEDKFLVKEGDILFTRTGASVGKSYLYNVKDGKLYFAGFLIRFSIRLANPYFIFSQTRTSKYQKWVRVMSMRSGQPGINAEEYKSFKFDIPSLKEQQKIANYLSAIDTKIENVQTQIEKTQAFKKGLLQQMFV